MNNTNKKIRKGCKDIWNLYLTRDDFKNDYPYYEYKDSVPTSIISIIEAVSIYKTHLRKGISDFKYPAYVDFTTADINSLPKYDLWKNHKFLLMVTSHFEGIIAPYYACEHTNRLIRHNYNLYKMHTMAKHATESGQNVIFNYVLPLGNDDSTEFFMIKENSIIYIDIRNYKDEVIDLYSLTNKLRLLLKLRPRCFILVGNTNNPKYEIIKESGVNYIFFDDSNDYSFIKTRWQIIEENDKIFSKDGYPICIPKKQSIPKKIISWSEAIRIYKKEIISDKNFKIDAYVHFYIDDQVFDGPYKGIWNNPNNAIKILIHFRGIITVDYSTYLDFPIPLKQFAIYRMLLSGILANEINIEVINNLRLDLFNSYPSNYLYNDSIIAIGTVASNLKTNFYKSIFNKIYNEYFEHNKVKTVITLGSANYVSFNKLRLSGTEVISFKSQTNLAFEGGEDKNV